MLCKFDGDVPLPAIWSHQVKLSLCAHIFYRSCALKIKCKCFQINRLKADKCIKLRYVQVLEEYKKMYPEEELPDFLKYNYYI